MINNQLGGLEMARKKTLKETMAEDHALVTANQNWDAPVVLEPSPASRGTSVPVLPEWATAMMIMHGIKARWVINYWLVSNKYGAESGVSSRDNYDEWESVIKNMASRTATR